jgi:hypothetical protein
MSSFKRGWFATSQHSFLPISYYTIDRLVCRYLMFRLDLGVIRACCSDPGRRGEGGLFTELRVAG